MTHKFRLFFKLFYLDHPVLRPHIPLRSLPHSQPFFLLLHQPRCSRARHQPSWVRTHPDPLHYLFRWTALPNMEVVPGKMGQRGIHLQAEKTPNMGNPLKANYQEKMGNTLPTTIFCKRWQSCHLSSPLVFAYCGFLDQLNQKWFSSTDWNCFRRTHQTDYFYETDLLSLIRW